MGWSAALALGAALGAGCSATNGTPGAVANGSGGSSSGGSGTAGPGGSAPLAGSLNVDIPPQGGGTGGTGGGASCATQKVNSAVVRQPVDIVVVIDNSGSMQDEIDAVERNINDNFANVLQTSGVDYRVILISRHEKGTRQTSICVSAPLSSNPTCPAVPDQPHFSERFYQYSLKVDSLDSLVLIIDTYDATQPDEFGLAPMGWSAWLRPGAQKVFLEITDDNSAEMTAADFETRLFALSPDHFGTAAAPRYTFHSIIGIGEKSTPTDAWLPSEDIQSSLCTGNANTVENAGPVYQELSRKTGGLRFPLCQFTAFDTVFESIANNVASRAAIACEFDIPAAPADRELDLAKVAVGYDAGDGGAPKTFGQAMSLAECVPEAFYIDAPAQKIRLCPETCTAVQNGPMPTIDVLFTCEETFVPPPK